MAKMEGTDDARDFELPFDATGTTTQLERVDFNLHLTGPGNVHLWNVKLVQYPDGKFSTIASSSTSAHLGGETLAAALPSPIPSLQRAFQVISPATTSIASDSPEIKVIAELPVEKYLSSAQEQKNLLANYTKHEASDDQAQVSITKGADGTPELLLIRKGNVGLCRMALLTIPQELADQITGTRYGITGEVSYSLSENAGLTMNSMYTKSGLSAPDDLLFQQMDGPLWGARDETMGLMHGDRDWGKFYLGFDRRMTNRWANGGPPLILKRIVFGIVLDGPGTVHIRNLKLVQYAQPLVGASTPANADKIPESQMADKSASSASKPEFAPGMQVITELPVDKYTDTAQNMGPGTKMTLVDGEDGDKDLVITRSGDAWFTTSVLQVPEDLLHKVTAPRFGFTGEVKCAEATTILAMGLGFVARIDPLPEITEPRSEISQGNEWQSFEVQFDRGHSGYVLEHLGLWLKFYGSATVQLRHLRLVQYPEEKTATPPITLAQADGVMTGEGKDVLKITWFCLGAAATGLALLATSGLIIAARVWQRRRHERELRRIASLDT